MKTIQITEEKLKDALQIVLGSKGIYTERFERELVEQIIAFDMHIVMPMLLCKNNVGTKYLTINKKYKIENLGDGMYTLIDDIGEINFYSSSRFELVEAQ